MDNELMVKDISASFQTQFGEKPAHIITAPGRVNLIGEHTDYNGLPVMPMSIPHRFIVAVSPRTDNNVSIVNTNPDFGTRSFEVSDAIPHSSTGDWSNYVKAAVNQLASHLPGRKLNGMNAVFHGDVPNSAGLSSSSALVIASALSFLAANNTEMDIIELAEAMAYGEHYVGTQGGGMDQAICLLGRAGHAVKIDFFPLRHHYVPFPDNHSVIVAHSMVRAAKTENALLLYNRRPAECRLATAMLNAHFNPDTPLERLGDLLKHDFYTSVESPESFVDGFFACNSYTLADIASQTGHTEADLTETCLYTRSGEAMPEPPDGFLIRQRAMHVLTEGQRVEQSIGALADGNATSFGALMNSSHESCDKLYGISTPELNRLTEIMRESGAKGSRLTGAGFGGCAIGLFEDTIVQQALDSIRRKYYNDYLGDHRPESSQAKEGLLFSLKPADGATVSAYR